MKILLVGEFSRLHNSLKEGLLALGHEVVLVNNGDGFKNFPADISIRAAFFKSKVGNIPRQIWFRIFKFDLAILEHGVRFWWISKKLKNFDVVQLINETPIQTVSKLELFLLKRILKQNKKVFLMCCGIDYMTVSHMLQQKDRYSVMNPYFEGIAKAKKQYDYYFDFLTKSHQKIHQFYQCRQYVLKFFQIFHDWQRNQYLNQLLYHQAYFQKFSYSHRQEFPETCH